MRLSSIFVSCTLFICAYSQQHTDAGAAKRAKLKTNQEKKQITTKKVVTLNPVNVIEPKKPEAAIIVKDQPLSGTIDPKNIAAGYRKNNYIVTKERITKKAPLQAKKQD